MSRQIVFEDDEIRVIFKPGTKQPLLISFSDLVTVLDGDRFFGDVPAEKLDMAAIGIVAKKANWFPAASMVAARAAIDSFLRQFPAPVTYGGSMGGYGAIKYSRLLNADAVISLCPQWSLDRKECGFQPGWQRHYTPDMAGMGIRPDDVAGRVYLIADINDDRDGAHVAKIAEAVADARIINVPLVGHQVTTVVARTANLAELIAAGRADDPQRMRRVARDSRRFHRHRLTPLLSRAYARRPGLLYPVLSRWLDSATIDTAPLTAESLRIMASCCRRYADTAREGKLVALLCRVEPDPKRQASLAQWSTSLTGKAIAIGTHHKTRLQFDPATGTLRNGPPELPHLPVHYHISGQTIRFQLRAGGMTLDLCCADEIAGLAGAGDVGLLVPVGPGSFAIRFGDYYLSALPDGKVVANRREVKNWEVFRFLF